MECPYQIKTLENGSTQIDVVNFSRFSRINLDMDNLKEEAFSKDKSITVVTYQNITYSTPDNEHLYIVGGENCSDRISRKAFMLLTAFPIRISRSKKLYDEDLNAKVKKSWDEPYPYDDHIKYIKISGNIKHLDFTSDGENSDHYKCPFINEHLYNREDDKLHPFFLCNLETIDIEECNQLKTFEWEFFFNPFLRKLILPNHKITAHSYVPCRIGLKCEIINKEFVEEIQPQADVECCNIN